MNGETSILFMKSKEKKFQYECCLIIEFNLENQNKPLPPPYLTSQSEFIFRHMIRISADIHHKHLLFHNFVAYELLNYYYWHKYCQRVYVFV